MNDPRKALTAAYRYYVVGDTLTAIGRDMGVSREAVRLWLRVGYPEFPPGHAWSRMQRDLIRRDQNLAELARLLETAPECAVCGYRVIRPDRRDRQNRTCSRECTDIWPFLRQTLDEVGGERHRDHMARTILRHQDRYPDTRIAWAQRRLVEGVERNRTFIVAGSKVDVFFHRRPDVARRFGVEVGQGHRLPEFDTHATLRLRDRSGR